MSHMRLTSNGGAGKWDSTSQLMQMRRVESAFTHPVPVPVPVPVRSQVTPKMSTTPLKEFPLDCHCIYDMLLGRSRPSSQNS